MYSGQCDTYFFFFVTLSINLLKTFQMYAYNYVNTLVSLHSHIQDITNIQDFIGYLNRLIYKASCDGRC